MTTKHFLNKLQSNSSVSQVARQSIVKGALCFRYCFCQPKRLYWVELVLNFCQVILLPNKTTGKSLVLHTNRSFNKLLLLLNKNYRFWWSNFNFKMSFTAVCLSNSLNVRYLVFFPFCWQYFVIILTFNKSSSNLSFPVYLNGPFPGSLLFFRSFSSKHLQQINVKNINIACSAGIWTHNLNMSLRLSFQVI